MLATWPRRSCSLSLALICINIMNECHSANVASLKRHPHGDLYTLKEYGSEEVVKNCTCLTDSTRVANVPSSLECHCQCKDSVPIFREDTLACVQNINECSLASSTISEIVPHFSIDQKTRFISAIEDIPDLNVKKAEEGRVSPFCIIARGQHLTEEGWKDLSQSSFDVPFHLTSGLESLSLNWVGNASSTRLVGGRIVLLHLLCKNAASTSPTSFKQCVSFRLAGRRDLRAVIISELESESGNHSLTTGVIVAIGLFLGSLSLCYVLLSYCYIKMKKRNKKPKLSPCERLKEIEKTLKEKHASSPPSISSPAPTPAPNRILLLDHETSKPSFVFHRPAPPPPVAKPVSKSEHKELSHPLTRNTLVQAGSKVKKEAPPIPVEEDEIYSTPSAEEEVEGRRQRYERLQRELAEAARDTARLAQNDDDDDDDDYDEYATYEATPSALRLPIVEMTDPIEEEEEERGGGREGGGSGSSRIPRAEAQQKNLPQGMKTRRRLFFNPSYFDPEMLHSPPPSAVAFLSSVRSMMVVAKQKMQMKSFRPTLIDIPEDYGFARKNNKKVSNGNENTLSTVANRVGAEKEDCLDEVDSETERENENGLNGEEIEDGFSTYDVVVPNCEQVENNEDREDIYQEPKNVKEPFKDLDQKPHRMKDTNVYVKMPIMYKSPLTKGFSIVKIDISEDNSADNTVNSRKTESKNSTIKRNMSLKENLPSFRNSVENIKQEIQSKLNRVSSLSFKRNRKQYEKEKAADQNSNFEARKNKVHNWLHSLESPSSNDSQSHIPACPVLERCDKDKLPTYGINSKYPKDSKTIQINIEDGILDSSKLLSNSFNKPELNCSVDLSYNNTYEGFCQQDNEVYTIDVNAPCYEKEDSFNTSFTQSDTYQSPSSASNITDILSLNGNGCHQTTNYTLTENLLGNKKELKESKNNSLEENAYEEIGLKDNSLKSKYKKFNFFRCQSPPSNEIHVPGSYSVDQSTENNRLCIELGKENTDKSSPKKEKNRNQVKRNDSIVQDSLERPKLKKKLNRDDSFGKDGKNLESLFSNFNLHKPEKAPTIRRSKTMKTFKDYKHIRFCSSKTPDNNKLAFFGEGINLNYSTGRSSFTEEATKPPPIPPKITKSESQNSLEDLFNRKIVTPEFPTSKTKIRYSNSFSPLDFGRRPRQLVNIHSDNENIAQLHNTSMTVENNKSYNKPFSTHLQPDTNRYNPDELSLDSSQDYLENKLQKGSEQSNLNELTSKALQLVSINQQHLHNLHITGKIDESLNSLPNQTSNTNFANRKDINGSISNRPEVSLRRKDSLYSKEQQRCNKVMEQDKTEGYLSGLKGEADLVFKEKVKEELEKYLGSKVENNSLKQDWRNLVNRLDTGLQEDQVFNKDINNCLQETNQNQSNNNVYYKSNSSKNNNMPNSDSMKVNLQKSNSICHRNSFKKTTSNFIQRSVSLHRMAREKSNKLSLSSNTKTSNPTYSVYVNDSFSIDS